MKLFFKKKVQSKKFSFNNST